MLGLFHESFRYEGEIALDYKAIQRILERVHTNYSIDNHCKIYESAKYHVQFIVNHSIKVSKFFYLYITLPLRYEIRFMTTPSLAF